MFGLRLLIAVTMLSSLAVATRANADRVDFDGDGLSDAAVWRPSEAAFYVRPSLGVGVCPPQMRQYSEPGVCRLQMGKPGDIPFAADFDQNGVSDFTVYRPSTATWYIRFSFSDVTKKFRFGNKGDIPDAMDLDWNNFAEILAVRKKDRDGSARIIISDFLFPERLTIDMGRIPSSARQTVNSVPGRFDGAGYLEPGLSFSTANGGTRFTTVRWRKIFVEDSNSPARIQYNVGPLKTATFQSPRDSISFFGRDSLDLVDFITFSPSDGQWTVTPVSNAIPQRTYQWGAPGDTPLVGRFTNNYMNDLVVWRGSKGPWEGTWFIKPISSQGRCPITSVAIEGGCYLKLGLSGDIPLDESSPRAVDR